jgi:hypothetical protein
VSVISVFSKMVTGTMSQASMSWGWDWSSLLLRHQRVKVGLQYAKPEEEQVWLQVAGHQFHGKPTKGESPDGSGSADCTYGAGRLTAEDFKKVTRQRKDGIIYGPTLDGGIGPRKFIRPKPGKEIKDTVTESVQVQ